MTTWQCEVCGYVHTGDSPPEYCPVCGAERELFHILEIHRETPLKVAADAWQCGICDYLHRGDAPPSTCPVCGAGENLFAPHRESAAPSAPPGDIEKIVIVGSGVAGMTAATEARRQSPQADVVLMSREPLHPYYRLNLTRYLAGEVPEDRLIMQSPRWFEDQRIGVVTAEVMAIDREQRLVRLRDGRQLAYDRLILANGAHPFIPPIPGATREGVLVLRTLEDARVILRHLDQGKRVVVIGGGLLGLETAGALSKRDAVVTVVEGFSWLLPRQLTPRAGRLLQQRLEKQGITVFCGGAVRELTGDERVRGVLLENDEELQADFVVIAAGVRPNSHLARQSGLKVHGGVVVDDRMFTSDPAILAAGDVAEHRGRLYGIWPAGYAQGMVAGINAAGGQAEFSGMAPSARIKVLDVDLYSIGQIQPEDASTTVCEENREGAYSALFCRDGQVVGAVLYGDTGRAGLVKEVVESGRQISEFPELTAAFPELAQSDPDAAGW